MENEMLSHLILLINYMKKEMELTMVTKERYTSTSYLFMRFNYQ